MPFKNIYTSILQKNEFRNSVFALEEVASFLWDIDQTLSQKMYDLVHSMDDAIYLRQNKLDEFLKSIDEVEPEYQQLAFEQCCLVIGNHMRQRGSL